MKINKELIKKDVSLLEYDMYEINTDLEYKDFIIEFEKGKYDNEIREYFIGLFEVAQSDYVDMPDYHITVNIKDINGQIRTLESNRLSFEQVRDLTDEQIIDLYNFLEIKTRIISIYNDLVKQNRRK